jgi:hypothetical protein
MARAPKSSDPDGATPPPQEADVLEGWPAPRETMRLFGHEAGEARFHKAFAGERLHHAWLISGEPGIGKATLAYRLARHVLAAGGGRDEAVAKQVASLSHPGLFVVKRSFQQTTGKFSQTSPSMNPAAEAFFRHHRRHALARCHRGPRGRSEHQFRQCAVEIAGGTAAAHGVPARQFGAGAAVRNHPFALLPAAAASAERYRTCRRRDRAAGR